MADKDSIFPSGVNAGTMLLTAQHADALDRLLLRLADRDERAFGQLYAATRRKLFATILTLVRRRHVAEEILQETYVRVWLNAASYRPALGSPMIWMTAIARNLSIDAIRKSTREVQSDESVLAGVADDGPTALETIEIREEQQAALDSRRGALMALQALDATKRGLVMAAYLDGESRDRLSERYGVPVNTIKTWIRRALIEIRSNLQTTPQHSAYEEPQVDLPIRTKPRRLRGQSAPCRPEILERHAASR